MSEPPDLVPPFAGERPGVAQRFVEADEIVHLHPFGIVNHFQQGPGKVAHEGPPPQAGHPEHGEDHQEDAPEFEKQPVAVKGIRLQRQKHVMELMVLVRDVQHAAVPIPRRGMRAHKDGGRDGRQPRLHVPLLGVEEAAAQGVPKLHVGIGAQGKAAFGDGHRRLNDFLGDAVVVQHARLKAAQVETERLAAIVLLQQLLPCEDGTVLQVHADEAERVFDVRAEKMGGDKAVAQQHVPADPEAEHRQQHQIEHQPERDLGIEAVRHVFQGHASLCLINMYPSPRTVFR